MNGNYLNKIHLEDCLIGLDGLENESVDIVVTSPPYNIGVNYSKYKDNKPFDEYLDWMENITKKIKKVLKDDGSFFLNIGDKPSDEFRSMKVALKISKHFSLQNTIHWVKHIDILEDEATNLNENLSAGHYKPVNSDRFLNNCHEYIFHFTKNNDVKLDKLSIGVPYADKSNIGRWKKAKKDLRARGNMWFIPYETVVKKKSHPAAFPIDLPKKCIKLHGYNEDTVVLDPFMGSGTTAFACKELGCKYIGFEIDKKYIEEFKKIVNEPKQLKIEF